MIPSRAIRMIGGAALLSVMTMGCATAAPPAEPARPANVPGLVPFPAPATAVPAPATAVPAPEPPAGSSPIQVVPPTTGDAVSEVRTADSTCAARVGTRALRRSALSRTLDAGLGTWLRGVDVEPKIDRGRFQGWLVRGIYAGDPCWADIGLRAGDVVNRVNRRPIERPEEAQAVWTALRGSGEIVIDLVRAGKPRTLRFDVVDDPE